MALFILGLVLFLGSHSLRVFADDWRTAKMAQWGEKFYKGLYSVASLVGFVLMVYGFSKIRWDSPWLWYPPVGMRHLAALLMLPALVLLVASQVPNNAIKAKLRHPMVLAVKVWALAHLLSNGKVADLVLFGAFLVWAVLNFRAARQRDRLAAHTLTDDATQPANLTNTWRVVLVGVAVWAILLFGGHKWLFAVSPLGM
ncbi:MAG: protein NrnU [Burkholderiales bacterium]|nr:protein NrnU [Burkholderiales bacterium]